MHESLPQSATTRKGRLRAGLSEDLLQAHRRNKLRVVVGRGSDFYGPRVGESQLGRSFFEAVLTGKRVLLPGDPDQPHTYTFIRDFARGLVMLSEHPESWGQLWHVPNAPTISTTALLHLLEEQVGHLIPTRRIPRWVVKFGGWFNPLMHEFVEMLFEFEKPFIVSHDKFARAFGDTATPLADALAETLAWYQQKQAGSVHQTPQSILLP